MDKETMNVIQERPLQPTATISHMHVHIISYEVLAKINEPNESLQWMRTDLMYRIQAL